jgi:hypothetical protein
MGLVLRAGYMYIWGQLSLPQKPTQPYYIEKDRINWNDTI